jgi:hypothetical protein
MQRSLCSSRSSSSSQSLGNRGQVTCRGSYVPAGGPAPHSPLEQRSGYMQRSLCSTSRSSSSQLLGNRGQVTCRGCPGPAGGPAPHSPLGTEVRLHAKAVVFQQEFQLLTVTWEQRSGYMQRPLCSSRSSSSSQSLVNRGPVKCMQSRVQ